MELATAIWAVKRLCRRCAPHELRGRPLHLHLADGPGRAWAAYTHPELDLLFHAGRTRRGWAVVVRRTLLGNDEWAPLELALHVLHELAHALTWDNEPVALTPSRLAFERLALRRVLESAAPLDEPALDPAHGLNWHRAAIHLAYRAQQLGWDIRPTYGLGIGWFGHFTPEQAVAALGDEPKRMADWPFKRILGTGAPKEFRNLFSNEES